MNQIRVFSYTTTNAGHPKHIWATPRRAVNGRVRRGKHMFWQSVVIGKLNKYKMTDELPRLVAGYPVLWNTANKEFKYIEKNVFGKSKGKCLQDV